MNSQCMNHPELNGSSFLLKGSNNGILLFHGFTATTIEVRPLAHVLNDVGYTIMAPLLPGHGTCPEDMNSVKWQQWVNAAMTSYTQLCEICDSIVVMGESMGGLLSLYLAGLYTKIHGVVLFAPAIKIHGLWKAKFARYFINVQPKTYVHEGGSHEIYPWQGYSVVPVKAAAQLELLQKKVLIRLEKVNQPALIFQGCLDTTIDPSGSKIIYKKIKSCNKTITFLDRSGHCLILDQQFDQVAQSTLDFLKQILPDGDSSWPLHGSNISGYN